MSSLSNNERLPFHSKINPPENVVVLKLVQLLVISKSRPVGGTKAQHVCQSRDYRYFLPLRHTQKKTTRDNHFTPPRPFSIEK